MTVRRWCALLLLAAAAGCAATADAPPLPDAALRAAHYVLLGELHDNPLHHAQRAALLRALLADGRPTRVVLEQIDRGHDEAIAAAVARSPGDAEAVADAAQLDRKGWGWPLHKPLIEAALAGGARIVGGNLSREDARAVVRGGVAAAPAELRRWLGDEGWGAARQAEMEAEVDAGHCGLLPASQWPAMVLAQRARDAALAQAMLAPPPGERVVLIAGNGHVRSDLGVPRLLRAAGVPADQIVAILWLEPEGTAPPGDRVVRTAAAPREDPCAALRERGMPGATAR